MKQCFTCAPRANRFNDWSAFQRPFSVGFHTPNRHSSKYFNVSPKIFNVMEHQENKPNFWLKIGKLFLEFVVAAVTALVTTLSGQAANLW